MTTIIIALIFFSIIVLVHELGHFLTAKAVGIYAEEFSIGMGPRLFKYEGKETVYSFRVLPIGGYVKFLGEDEDSNDPRAFTNAKVWQRIMVIASGPIMNFILAVILLTVSYSTYGIFDEYIPVIGGVMKDFPAEQAGMQVGDRIIEINDIDISGLDNNKAVDKIRDIINDNGDKSLNVVIKRGDQLKSFELIPKFDEEGQRHQLGFYFDYSMKRLNILSSIGLSIKKTGEVIKVMVLTLGEIIFKGNAIDNLAGPVGIVGEIGKAAKAGFLQLLNLGILITINLGIVNLIPFPALDGGRLVLLIVEGLRGKPIDRKKEGFIHLIGFVLLILLMIIVTYKDILRI